MADIQYPEAEKWAKVHSDAVAITGFIDWRDYHYADVEEWQRPPLQDQLYTYFEIDSKKLEEERQAMIQALQG